MRKLFVYLTLLRLNKPIGILLLLWPTLWALWIASNGHPSLKNLFIFILGVVCMRSAGCIINDLADQHFDKYVDRTKNRPLTSGKIHSSHAFILFFILCFISFFLVLFTNFLTCLLAFFALMIAILYPFMKRFTHWPQFILGIAFSFSIPMAFAAEIGKIPFIAFIMMLTNVLWSMAYDTEYAMVDRIDDLKIGIKSTAILFGKYDRFIIGIMQFFVLTLLILIGYLQKYSIFYYALLFIVVLLFIYQQHLIFKRKPEACFHAFLNNQWVGLLVFVGILLK